MLLAQNSVLNLHYIVDFRDSYMKIILKIIIQQKITNIT